MTEGNLYYIWREETETLKDEGLIRAIENLVESKGSIHRVIRPERDKDGALYLGAWEWLYPQQVTEQKSYPRGWEAGLPEGALCLEPFTIDRTQVSTSGASVQQAPSS